jgi:hypothetical protein
MDVSIILAKNGNSLENLEWWMWKTKYNTSIYRTNSGPDL